MAKISLKETECENRVYSYENTIDKNKLDRCPTHDEIELLMKNREISTPLL